MSPKKRPNAAAARLSVLAATADDETIVRTAIELLGARDRLSREAALDTLLAHPDASARPMLRSMFFDLDEDGLKRDQGAIMRIAIVRILRALGDARDADVALAACDTYEIAFGEDIAASLRAHGLMLLADLAPDRFPFIAVEHLEDRGPNGEPANTAFQLLAGSGNHAAIYQWLLGANPADPLIAGVFELLAEGPPEPVERYARRALAAATREGGEALATAVVEAVIRLELEACYPAVGGLMSAKISDELYNYLAVLLASTNRSPLLAILEEQLRHGRRSNIIEAALRVRTTPEQEAILRRWEER
ncbi:MAG TPA: hypothetical protein VFY79_13490 [Dehalococcoidia bacterium]|nr:hypothetical protein [Dehalococcoidia bacterium]